jgi:hypothetical protein
MNPLPPLICLDVLRGIFTGCKAAGLEAANHVEPAATNLMREKSSMHV